MFKSLFFALALLAPCVASSATISADFDVKAFDNSYNRGAGTGLATGIMLQVGESFQVAVDPLQGWRIAADLPLINADGLFVGRTRGFSNYRSEGFVARYGTLVGRIGTGAIFRIGSSFDGLASVAGELRLYVWDSRTEDNSGSLSVRLTSPLRQPVAMDVPSPVPLPATGLLLMSVLAFMGLRRRVG